MRMREGDSDFFYLKGRKLTGSENMLSQKILDSWRALLRHSEGSYHDDL